ncbi:MAG: hypothetical protein P9M14_04860 [Candidatus Alcyoniella australis]|nr:hypothetical protein [Candidatus Alcyoniella australis]
MAWKCGTCGQQVYGDKCPKCGEEEGAEDFARAFGVHDQLYGQAGPSKEREPPSGACIVASACRGPDSPLVAGLRQVRDSAISRDPVARDFFHVFWSRYYEWSPAVARIAAEDREVAEHIRWAFLDPWLAWLEFASLVGRSGTAELTDEERRDILERLDRRLGAWLSELPARMESKCPADPSELLAAFERFRQDACRVFDRDE